jgi:hypothetical protein
MVIQNQKNEYDQELGQALLELEKEQLRRKETSEGFLPFPKTVSLDDPKGTSKNLSFNINKSLFFNGRIC